MNTILTDDELPPLQPHDHPEPHSFAWTEQEMRAIRARDRLVEAAVLAKLREQEPIYQYQMNDGTWIDQTRESYEYNLKNWTSEVRVLYAAPLPAVVQVPQGLIDAVDRVLEEAYCNCPPRLRLDDGEHLSGCPLFDLNVARLKMLAAAPEAPAQGRIETLRAAYPQAIQDACAEQLKTVHTAHPSVPAPWREVVKVMREALAVAIYNMDAGMIVNNHGGRDFDFVADLDARCTAAIALADSLEGGE